MSFKLVGVLLGVGLLAACGRAFENEGNPTPDSGFPAGSCLDNDGDGYPGTGDCSAVPPDQLDCNDNDPAVHPGAPELCNGKDDDCDGRIDNVHGTANPITKGCYDGPAATRGVGACKDGAETCANAQWGACLGETLPTMEVCNGVDDDCDGHVDNVPGTTTPLGQSCYSGPAGTKGVGVCTGGTQQCAAGSWGTCAGEVVPTPEQCNGLDDDCDGHVDNNPGTTNPLTGSCYSGPSGTAGVGACLAGTATCTHASWGTCVGQVLPVAETCNGIDDDCDGRVDNVPGTANPLSQSCYTGPEGTAGVGACKAGASACVNATWGACTGQVVPTPEVCNGIDDDCDGRVDNVPGTATPLTESCYSGPAGTAGVGPCRAGTSTCANAAWGACAGQVLPTTEVCNGIDDDCDGRVDNVPGTANPLTQSCYDGPAGTVGVGVCRAGTSSCTSGVWGGCAGEVLPQPPACDGLDNNCNGVVDEPFVSATSDIDTTHAWADVAFAPYYYSAGGCAGGVNGAGTDALAGGALVGTTGSAMFFQKLDATGSPLGAPVQVESRGYDVVAIAQAGDGFMLAGVWNGDHQSIDEVYVDASGTKRADLTPALSTRYITEADGGALTNTLDSLRLVRGNGKRVSLVWREVAAGDNADSSRQGVFLMSIEPIDTTSWSICDPGGSHCPPTGTKYNAWTNVTLAAGLGADSTHPDWGASETCAAASGLRPLAVAYVFTPVFTFGGCGSLSSCVSYFDVQEDGSAPAHNAFPGTGIWGAPAFHSIAEPELTYFLPSSGTGAGADQWLTAWVTNANASGSSDLDYWMTTDPTPTPAYATAATVDGASSISHPRATATANELLVTALRYVSDASGFDRQMMSRWLDFSGSKVPASTDVELSALTGACGPVQCVPGQKAGLANWAAQQKIFYSAAGASPAGTFDSTLTCN